MTGKLPPKAAEPQFHGRAFDPWNSVAAGHQRAEARGPGGWRENRTHKLNSQLRGGNASGRRVQDAVGPGADPEQPQRTPNAPQPSVLDMLRRPGHAPKPVVARTAAAEDRPAGEAKTRSGIFAGLVVYVNGSTHPLVSDHKLKRLLAEQGARAALHLGRRQVTHVIVGRPAAPGAGGAGGGLAGGKIQREIARARGGCGVKFVGVEWVLESIKAGIRLPEARFAPPGLVAPRAQPSVLGVFGAAPSAGDEDGQQRRQPVTGQDAASVGPRPVRDPLRR